MSASSCFRWPCEPDFAVFTLLGRLEKTVLVAPGSHARPALQEIISARGFGTPLEPGGPEDARSKLCVVKFLVLKDAHPVETSILSISLVHRHLPSWFGIEARVGANTFQIRLRHQKLLVEEACVDFHAASVHAELLATLKPETSVILGHNPLWWNNISGLVDFLVSLKRLLQISFRVVLTFVKARDEIMLVRTAEILNGFIVAVAAIRIAVNVLNLVLATDIVLQSVHDALNLES